MTSRELAKAIYEYIDEKKGIDIRIIDISKISVLADYFIIAGGSNLKQIQSVVDNIEEKLGKQGIAPKSIEGRNGTNWILMDYRDVIVHIFNQEDRLFYDLERIWMDGVTVESSEL
ncbi:MAG: ribosome silencing factor [Parasporobacterium sp.]|nr:ribosome silencing factor [Parasporobacterium sp.]